MKQTYCNDQAYIAEAFHLDEDYINQMARLAWFKVNSYKLSLVNAAFCASKEELSVILKTSLLNYTDPSSVLVNTGFFTAVSEN